MSVLIGIEARPGPGDVGRAHPRDGRGCGRGAWSTVATRSSSRRSSRSAVSVPRCSPPQPFGTEPVPVPARSRFPVRARSRCARARCRRGGRERGGVRRVRSPGVVAGTNGRRRACWPGSRSRCVVVAVGSRARGAALGARGVLAPAGRGRVGARGGVGRARHRRGGPSCSEPRSASRWEPSRCGRHHRGRARGSRAWASTRDGRRAALAVGRGDRSRRRDRRGRGHRRRPRSHHARDDRPRGRAGRRGHGRGGGAAVAVRAAPAGARRRGARGRRVRPARRIPRARRSTAACWSVVLLVGLLAPVLAVAWPLGALADRGARVDADDQRMPESRNASA